LNVTAQFQAICPISMSTSVINYLEMLIDFNTLYLSFNHMCIYWNDDGGGVLLQFVMTVTMSGRETVLFMGHLQLWKTIR